MYKDHEHLDKVEDKLTLWKYMDFAKFANLIETSSLWFNRIDQFEDPFEGTYSHANEKLRNNIYDFTIPKEIYEQIQSLAQDHLFVSCFHQNKYESAAMWRLYADTNGIAIKTNVERLKNCFVKEKRDVYISRVEYIDFEKDFLPEGNMFYLGTHKRKSFEYEQEIRCLYSAPANEEVQEYGMKISVDLPILIQKIYISPYAASYIEETLERFLETHGLCIDVCKSNLYEMN